MSLFGIGEDRNDRSWHALPLAPETRHKPDKRDMNDVHTKPDINPTNASGKGPQRGQRAIEPAMNQTTNDSEMTQLIHMKRALKGQNGQFPKIIEGTSKT